jgi:sirohydrochlorin cobaltochelatase
LVTQRAETGLVLIAHGARDPAWRQPFDSIRETVAHASDKPVALCFLEFMSPDLLGASRDLKSRGANEIDVLPLFLGAGGHVRRDLPVLVERVSHELSVPIRLLPSIGESPEIVAAIAHYCQDL